MSVWDGDDLHVAAPQLHFLAGKPLERLERRQSVVFLTQLTLTTEASTVFCGARRSASYSATTCGKRSSQSRSLAPGNGRRASFGGWRRRPGAWTTWPSAPPVCLPTSLSGCGSSCAQPIPKDEAAVIGEPGINLTRLIEMFSRRPRDQTAAVDRRSRSLAPGRSEAHCGPLRTNL